MNQDEIHDLVCETNRNIIKLKKLLELTQKFRGNNFFWRLLIGSLIWFINGS